MLGRVVVRRLSSLAEPLPRFTQGNYAVPNSSQYKKLMEKQKIFCKDDGLLVWRKRESDNFLYAGIIFSVVLATVFNGSALWVFASPPKNQ